MNKKLRGSIFLFLAALFWGSAFVAQDAGLAYLGPYALNGFRFVLGALFMIPLVLYKRARIVKTVSLDAWREVHRRSRNAGLVCGIFLAIATCLQQVGLVYTTPGKSGFITAMYIIIVPVLMGLVFRKRQKWNIWLACLMSLVGLYLLSNAGAEPLNIGDIFTTICAVAFAIHIIFVDKYSDTTDGLVLSEYQLLSAGVIGIFITLISGEVVTVSGIVGALPYALYIAIFSCCVAYTCQVLGQKDTPPAMACVLMSLESVFAYIFDLIINGASFSIREGLGAFAIFVAILIAQLINRDRVTEVKGG